MAKSRIAWDEKAPAAENARKRLPELLDAWFDLGQALDAAKASPRQMHAFRLRTKRLRYTLELFRPFYGPGLDRLIGLLRDVQRTLGEISDCASSGDLVARLMPAPSPRKTGIERFLVARARRLTAEFGKQWQRDFARAGVMARWRAYLSRRAGGA